MFEDARIYVSACSCAAHAQGNEAALGKAALPLLLPLPILHLGDRRGYMCVMIRPALCHGRHVGGCAAAASSFATYRSYVVAVARLSVLVRNGKLQSALVQFILQCAD